jgi:NAD(P)H-dependent flavin oxidoreductase YrpB (nitropropane dioxygenase family)
MRFAHRKGIQACIEGRVPAVSFFWVDPAEFIPAVHAAEIVVLHQVGSVDAAIRGKQAGGGRDHCARITMGGRFTAGP